MKESMLKLHKWLLMAGLVFVSLLPAQAQKYGHLNSAVLLLELPETQAADQQLKTYQEELVKKGEEMAKALQAKMEQFYKEYNEGKLAPIHAQQRQEELNAERQKIAQYEQEVVQKVTQRREELLAPILGKVQKAIEEVAKEHGYAMIFDSSIVNAILYLEESDDVAPLVKAKLGIQ